MVEQVPGVPEGYRLVRIGKPSKGELFITTGGEVVTAEWDFKDAVKPIVKKIEPVCTWPKGVFANGWIAMDKSGSLWWYRSKPVASGYVWNSSDGNAAAWVGVHFLNPPVFKAGLPWTECVQQVGPEVENE